MTTARHGAQLTEDVYVELVCSLFQTLLPTIIMATSFVVVGGWIASERPEPLLFVLFVSATTAALWRIGTLLFFRDDAQAQSLTAVRAGQLERRFSLPYIAFALFFGLFAARGFVVGANEHRLLIVGLVFGYGAGVAAGISLRPWIGIPSVLIAIVPMIVASFLVPGRWGTGLLTALFMAGGIESMLRRYQTTSRQFTMQRLLSTIDRADELTGLPNRLVLHERFAEIAAAASGAELVAVHCLVLDRVESVNELHGYLAGDAILMAAAERLERLAQNRIFVARIRGVEFAIVQPGLFQPRRAEMLAEEIVAMITHDYVVAGQEISIGAHAGFALDVQQGADLDRLLRNAIGAAHRARREARDVVGHDGPRWNQNAPRRRIDTRNAISEGL